MKALAILILFISSYSFAQNRAGVMAEPYAGYFTGEGAGPAIADGDFRSYTAGAKLGYRSESGWAFGIDYAQGQGDYETATNEFDVTTKDGGVFLGYYFPAYVSVYASYILQYELSIEETGGPGVNTEAEGTGFNVGISIRGIPFVRVNLTYAERELDEINGNSNLSGDNTVKTTMVSVSLPYNFPWKP